MDRQTFILVRDDAIVDLEDPANWVPSAEVYVVDKGQYESAGMAMNTANFGPFYFTGAVDLDGGTYMENRSVPAAVRDAEVTDRGITWRRDQCQCRLHQQHLCLQRKRRSL